MLEGYLRFFNLVSNIFISAKNFLRRQSHCPPSPYVNHSPSYSSAFHPAYLLSFNSFAFSLRRHTHQHSPSANPLPPYSSAFSLRRSSVAILVSLFPPPFLCRHTHQPFSSPPFICRNKRPSFLPVNPIIRLTLPPYTMPAFFSQIHNLPPSLLANPITRLPFPPTSMSNVYPL